MEPLSTKVLSFMDIYAQLQALRETVAEFRAVNAGSSQVLENMSKLDAAISKAAAVESAAAPLLKAPPDPRCACCPGCHAKRVRAAKPVKCSALARSFLQYKIIEALQPHPAYDSDDGFQPLCVIRSLKVDDDPKARQALAEFRTRDLPLMTIVAELVENGTVVQTPYEPWNGDVMLGLPEHLPARDAAHEERKKLIADLAEKYGHRIGWNEDGTGWLAPPCGKRAHICGSVWDLLSYLSAIELTSRKRPRSFH